MAKVYMYFPFKGYLSDSYAGGMESFLRSQDGSFEFTVVPQAKSGMLGSRVLARIGDDDLILAVSHGDTDHPDEMYLFSPSVSETMTANDLVDQMLSEGLPKTHQSILLMNCWGGGDSNMAAGKSPDMSGVGAMGLAAPSDIATIKNGYLQCLASVLGKAFGIKGYRSILVGGFPGVVTQSGTLGNAAFIAGAERVLAQIDHIQWFDATGQNTAVSAPPVGRVIGRARSKAAHS